MDHSSLFSKLTFYRQARVDGAVRTGLMLGEDSVLERFEEGSDDEDPILAWSVDLRCDGRDLPDTPEEARAWLLEHQDVIRAGFHDYAEELKAGSDPTGIYPLEWGRFRDVPDGVEMRIFCTALRRVDGLTLGRVVAGVGSDWHDLVTSLTPDRSTPLERSAT